MSDPLHDLEREVAALRAHVDLQNERVRSALARIEDDIERVKANQARLETDQATFVPLIRYLPIEKLVNGMVALTLSAVVLALIALVVRK